MITRIDYASPDGVREAVIERNDSDGCSWDVNITGVWWPFGGAHERIDESHNVARLTTAQQIARVWCDSGRRP